MNHPKVQAHGHNPNAAEGCVHEYNLTDCRWMCGSDDVGDDLNYPSHVKKLINIERNDDSDGRDGLQTYYARS